ncbi:DUF695 domain-containing protein [Acidovorax sp. RAC01]|uniref:DUF695 domain-containing protein n=1 Tax=Acidovorax sp. RAC01 TaxID=1842533 RepID=UPI00083E8C69|nr:DUF695 domain-containing protein [Acidovorax sp. RAC01]AOG24645.1 hypothetical protein BSY15_897 [Acidovorax sp. RAC01]
MTSTAANTTAFWTAFAAQEPHWLDLSPGDWVEHANALLDTHVEGLGLELQTQPGQGGVDLIVTAHGSIDQFPLAAQWAAAAPQLPTYRVSALRPRSTEPDFPLGMEGFEMSTTDVLVALQQDGGQVALELRLTCAVPAGFEEHAQHMAFIMVDHVLGEYDFAVKVGAVDFVDEATHDRDATWTPLADLPPVFDAYWLHTLGRTGLFPQGDGAWDGLELQFDCAVDDDGNAVEEDEDGGDGEGAEPGAVMINTSANAVAMRADLACALTLDLAVPDAAALAAAQALHEQAATLLQLPQLGILVLTLVRAGRRQALYYVSDEKLARQTLAPLLLREEAESLEVKSRYDPAWTGYFEYAAYLM